MHPLHNLLPFFHHCLEQYLLYELKELQNAAARTLQQTPAEEKLLRAPLGKEVDEAAEQKRVQNAQATANKNAEVRKNALFDFGNLIFLLL